MTILKMFVQFDTYEVEGIVYDDRTFLINHRNITMEYNNLLHVDDAQEVIYMGEYDFLYNFNYEQFKTLSAILTMDYEFNNQMLMFLGVIKKKEKLIKKMDDILKIYIHKLLLRDSRSLIMLYTDKKRKTIFPLIACVKGSDQHRIYTSYDEFINDLFDIDYSRLNVCIPITKKKEKK